MFYSTRIGYKGPLDDMRCKLFSSQVFEFKNPHVDIATNLMWDRDISWVRPGSIVIACYAGEYIDDVMIEKLDNLGQPIIVITPLTIPKNKYNNVIFHQLDFIHYDSLYYKNEQFITDNKYEFSCMNRSVRAWKYISLGFFIPLLNSLVYTSVYNDMDGYDADIIRRISAKSGIPFYDVSEHLKPQGTQTTETFEEQWDVHDYIKYSKFNLTNESIFDSLDDLQVTPNCYLTEKTLKPLAVGTFPIHVGQLNGYSTLEGFGFTGFSDVIDTSYDIETEDDLRFIGILDSIQKLCMENVTDVCYNNYKWFHNGFHDFMIEKNKPKIAELKRIVANL